jgi:hypothetical protein
MYRVGEVLAPGASDSATQVSCYQERPDLITRAATSSLQSASPGAAVSTWFWVRKRHRFRVDQVFLWRRALRPENRRPGISRGELGRHEEKGAEYS